MPAALAKLYYLATVERPLAAILLALLLLLGAGWYAQDFKLDASSDSLVLENDQDLRYYRSIRARYGSDDLLMVTYQPPGDLFADTALNDIRALRDELAALERVRTVTSLLDVPLIDSPPIGFGELQEDRTLLSPKTDRELARKEFHDSPLYRQLLTSLDASTTALLVYFKSDPDYAALLDQRDAIWEKRLSGEPGNEDTARLAALNEQIRQHNTRLQSQLQADIIAVRAILDRHRDRAGIHLGGVPMITSDMIDFIRSDIRVFGVGVVLFLVILLAVTFKQPRWVLVPMLICIASAVGMTGLLGLLDWRVTVVSSNFISLMLIITLSLAVHLIVRHQELHSEDPSREQRWLLRETVRSKFAPSVFTTLTTMVAFASFIVSGIRPVMDFGWMMVMGMAMAFVLAFILFPATLAFLRAGRPVLRHHDATAVLTRALAGLIERFHRPTLWLYLIVVAISLVGVSRLTVENRFIDYFKSSTEIHQGMVLIDRQMGGTTPLDVVLEPSSIFREMMQPAAEDPQNAAYPQGDADQAPLLDPIDPEAENGGISGGSYWFDMFQLEEVERIHAYLESLPETGKVLSLASTMALMSSLNNDRALDNLTLAVIHKRLPADIKTRLFDPYMSEDGNQVRFAIRIIDSDRNLQRDALLKKIRNDLVEKLGLEPEQVHLSGMLVLYNNVLQSLFRSQILTLSVVFLGIGLMFLLLFRSFKIAFIGMLPTITAAAMILGLMGWLGIPLDIMTITIAAITIGIGVDDTIHYIHRFREELATDGDYWAAVNRSHASVGRALYYTSITITLGFSILTLSNFIPSIYFGMLTGIAMVVALLANLTLLPVLLVKIRPDAD